MTIEQILTNWFGSLSGKIKSLFVVGGAVRNRLLGLPACDLDLVCDGARETAELLAAKRDAKLVIFARKGFPPCFRILEKDLPGSSIDISPLKGGDIRLDLAARDFTVNAIAIEVSAGVRLGEIFDPFGGGQDLERRLVRMVGSDVFRADPLRIFRAFRLAAELDFLIEPETLTGAAGSATLIPVVAGERIRNELELFFHRDNIAGLAGTLRATGVMEHLFPEIASRESFRPANTWSDRCTFACVEQLLENPEILFGSSSIVAQHIMDRNHRRFLVKTAAFLMDCFGPLNVEMAEAAALRLRMSAKQRKGFMLLVDGCHFFGSHRPGERFQDPDRFRRLGDEVPGACILAFAAGFAQGFSGFSPGRVKDSARSYLDRFRDVFSRPALVCGKDLFELGFSSGPLIGEILKYVRNAQDRGEIFRKSEAVDLVKRNFRPAGCLVGNHDVVSGPSHGSHESRRDNNS